MGTFKTHILAFLEKEAGIKDAALEIPPNPELGDYAFPCFSLSRQFKKAPQQIAQELAAKFRKSEFIAGVKAAGPYLNFFINREKLAEDTVKTILKEKGNYGSAHLGKGKHILAEHTSINPNASPHVGRARNALIGDSIVRLLRFQGYKVEVHYLVNDVGKQIAMLVLGAEGKEKVDFNDLLQLYVDINREMESHPEIEQQAFDLLNRLESGDKAVRKRFRDIVDTCIDGQKALFTGLGIHYDRYDYESEFLWNGKTDEALKKLEKTGKLFEDKEGRWVMNLEGYSLGMETPVLVMTRADKTSLYALRDVAYTMEKMREGENILVLGEDQKLYFGQIAAIMKELELPFPKVVHYSFVLLRDGKMSTRQGNVVLLEDFMKECVKKANAEIEKRYGKKDETAAKVIGYGALKYSILKVSPEKSVTFDLEQALSFEGDTGPYLQYSYARIASILRKHGKPLGRHDASLLKEPLEISLVKLLSAYPDTVEKATHGLHPHLIAAFLYDLAQKFNEFYHQHDIIHADGKIREARLALAVAVQHVLKSGLSLLGIGVLERM
ncbi:TPA: arginine--tRNA ligase [Candidatus Woesearchaeota archaeon]|nr:MAG: Arginyl-tRNA synthetase [archaeon GW2011_AR11]MBS3110638.1 arginine--tRNA ligase [Candidatus Woesearchaeota archaeon]HIH05270.1 arginine--tRNA ligase [Candidatus Woesearchaeota archaeon]HIH92315.1 arginine--tRNA ligase [Candidatus Woesearchaeota archaeon]HII64406.1 arginine--tRNA ligase [Candidatus Woesearchaeota archaeon]